MIDVTRLGYYLREIIHGVTYGALGMGSAALVIIVLCTTPYLHLPTAITAALGRVVAVGVFLALIGITAGGLRAPK